MIACFKVKRHKHEIEDDQTFFLKNGGVFLEELIAFCDGRSNPIRHISAKELLKATNYYDRRQIFLKDDDYQLYKGSLNDRPIFVKKYNNPWHNLPAMPYKDIAIGSQMSVHKNVVKLVGCCLETQNPILVYDFGGEKTLEKCIFDVHVGQSESLTWKSRVRIARDIAHAVAYLHTAFSRPVIHRDIKSSNIILDHNNVPKLMDFGLCISIPEGKSHVEDVLVGRIWVLPPEYLERRYLTEKVDVFLFGMLLVELLSGQEAFQAIMKDHIRVSGENCVEKLCNAVGSKIKNERMEPEQLLDFATLVLRCISKDEEKRPTMIEVAKELRRLDQSFPSPC